MRVLMLNGSARPTGNTYIALKEIGEQLLKEGIDYEIVNVGGAPIRDCLGCGQCEGECPQHLHIRQLLEAVDKAF